MSRINRNIVMFYIGALYLEALLLAPRGSIMKIFSKESLVSILVLIFLVSLSNKYFQISQRKLNQLRYSNTYN